MAQSRLSDLALLSIENDMLQNLDLEEVINDFASLKSRRAPLE